VVGYAHLLPLIYFISAEAITCESEHVHRLGPDDIEISNYRQSALPDGCVHHPATGAPPQGDCRMPLHARMKSSCANATKQQPPRTQPQASTFRNPADFPARGRRRPPRSEGVEGSLTMQVARCHLGGAQMRSPKHPNFLIKYRFPRRRPTLSIRRVGAKKVYEFQRDYVRQWEIMRIRRKIIVRAFMNSGP